MRKTKCIDFQQSKASPIANIMKKKQNKNTECQDMFTFGREPVIKEGGGDEIELHGEIHY